ncbi:CorA metal ion transporter [Arthrobotrys musiformis]|uniref:CorA metal ion transporter n=1 Tax=Arthrobotrys musiformis TaxID=47236 RepID=A0AAV9W4Q0_9PEZI
MAGSVASSASSSSSSSSSHASGSRRRIERASRNGSNVNVQATSNPTAVPGAPSPSANQLEPPISNRSPQSHRRRRRRNTLTTRRASVMVDNDNEISISNEVVDTARATATTITANIEENSPVASVARRNSAFYQLQIPIHQNLSSTSVDSTVLLDHREQKYTRPRRSSTMGLGEVSKPHRHHTIAGIPATSTLHNRPISPGKRHFHNNPLGYFHDYTQAPEDTAPELRRGPTGDYLSDSEEAPDTTTPLLARTPAGGDYHYHATERTSLFNTRPARPASISSRSSGNSRKRKPQHLAVLNLAYGNVNFPPSVPASPTLQPYASGVDESISPGTRGVNRRNSGIEDHVINIDGGLAQASDPFLDSTPPTPPPGLTRQRTGVGEGEEDVCFPVSDRLTDGMGTPTRPGENGSIRHGRRRRPREWPDLSVFEQWSREEKEERTAAEGIRARQVSEPVYVGGRLRPVMRGWHREVEDLPYRFTYFNDELGPTIHAQTISELVTPGETTFRDLFMPPPRVVSSSSDEESDCEDTECLIDVGCGKGSDKSTSTPRGGMGRVSVSDDLSGLDGMGTANNSGNFKSPFQSAPTKENNCANTASAAPATALGGAGVGSGEEERPTWWLDVLSPTKAEMKVFQDAFGIHPLTAEDILMQEPREKVELFRNYYLVSYRTFEQDPADEDYMEPVNFYIVVFRTGVLTFHFSMTPHSANVRRRIRQLKDYIEITADWISYALIDNITDAFGPIIQMIEDECDDIDDIILAEVETSSTKKSPTPSIDHTASSKLPSILRRPSTAAKSDVSTNLEQPDDASMLRRIATCRKKVMGLYRLMGNKADVIKGFSKRCNEQWDVAPRSEIGLYLGDIQDHIVTMVANLVHVEKILSRGHSNYLAQISIKMNERQEETADTLGRLTVLGTIVLPMNIVTGLWGMNVLVPGQGDEDHLMWFWGITAGLLMFGILCYFLAKRVYGIV